MTDSVQEKGRTSPNMSVPFLSLSLFLQKHTTHLQLINQKMF